MQQTLKELNDDVERVTVQVKKLKERWEKVKADIADLERQLQDFPQTCVGYRQKPT